LNDEHNRKHRKLFVFAIFAVFLGLMGLILPELGASDGGVSFDGGPVDMNGSSLYNGSVPSDSLKVNKSGDTMTGNLKIINAEIGSISNSSGFEFNSSNDVFYGSFDAYNDTNGGYMSLNANAYYDPINHFWYKKNSSQYAVITAQAYYKSVSISQPFWFVAFSAPSSNPFSNHNIPILIDPNNVNIYKNLTLSNLVVNGASDYLCIYANKTVYTSNTASC